MENVELNPDIRWHVRLDSRLKTIGNGIGGGRDIIVRDTSPVINLGDVAYWGTTSIDLEVVNEVFGLSDTNQ